MLKLVTKTPFDHLSGEELERLAAASKAALAELGAGKRRRKARFTHRTIDIVTEKLAAEARDRKTVARLMKSPAMARKVAAAQAAGDMHQRTDYDHGGVKLWVMGTKEDADPNALFVWVKLGMIVQADGSVYIEPWARPDGVRTDGSRSR